MLPSALHNRINRNELRQRAQGDHRPKVTLSFYRYFRVNDPQQYRDQLYAELKAMQVLGRVYVAAEGINAQISVPEEHLRPLQQALAAKPELTDIRLNVAVENPDFTFFDLRVKVKKKIVADGLQEDVDPAQGGKHLSAKEFNELISKPDTLLVDMRNFYEAEVGHFENALIPDVDTFREALPLVAQELAQHKDKQVVMYCTGGIRCEKASAYLIREGFQHVAQLNGGIINYAHQVRQEQLPNKFKGKNFVFDERLGESISQEIIGRCHSCGTPADTHLNCANDACHVLMILCPECQAKQDNCCSSECQEFLALPEDQKKAKAHWFQQRKHAKGFTKSLRKFSLPNLLGSKSRRP